MKTKTINKLLIGAILLGTPLTILGNGTDIAQAKTSVENQELTTKYPSKVMRTVRVELGVDKHSTELDSQISSMKQVDVLDIHLTSLGKNVTGKKIRNAVKDVFKIDLDSISKNNYGSKLTSYDSSIMETLRQTLGGTATSTELDEQIMNMSKAKVMDKYIDFNKNTLTAVQERTVINQIFGVNLEGISGLEYAQLSINSKGQWVIQNDNDLFVVSSSLDDVSVYVGVTDYFTQLTGSNDIPDSLKESLLALGYTYNEETNQLTYTNPSGESVPDAFKGQTMGIVVNAIMAINN